MASPLRVIPLGVGEAFTSRYYTSSVALGYGDAWILLDCPHPIRKMLREGMMQAGLSKPIDLGEILGVAVTHLHADHACGLEDYGYFCYYMLGRRARVLMHPVVSEHVWHGLLSAGMGNVKLGENAPVTRMSFDTFFDLGALDETRATTIGPFSIECRKTIHSVPTTALKISAGGKTLGLSSDTAFDQGLIDWLSDADFIIHEVTTFEDSKVHSPYRMLASLPAELRSRMRLTHYSDDFDLESSVIEPLRQGVCYTI